jgi:hypothetical protein
MNAIDQKHADNLRIALLGMYHSGEDGFEGLLGVALGSLTGQTFRLASSGSQRGRDGDSAFDRGETYFEGKRYRDPPGRPEISAKLYDLANDDTGQVDLWVLGATCEIPALTIADAEAFTKLHGIGIVKLDWSDNDFGSLLTAVVAAGESAKKLITDSLLQQGQSNLTPAAVAAIDHFSTHPSLPARIGTLRQSLSAEEAGLGHARSLNKEWMEKLFASKVRARAEFGQPLAPLDLSGVTAVPRSQQVKLVNAFTGQPASEFYAVVGEEGVGKSWICATAWLTVSPRTLLLICPADELLSPEATRDFQTFLIDKLIRQTGWQESERATNRWQRRLRGWRANPAPDNLRLTLIVDGLNQPRKADWARWLDRAAAELKDLGGCLVVTTRSTHWDHIRQSLASRVTQVNVPPFTEAEVKTVLTSKGIDPGKASSSVLASLNNPRLLGIAVDLLAAKDVEEAGQLSVGRLLFEHMRKAQVSGAAPLSGPEFATLLKTLAEDVLDRLRQQKPDDLRLFGSDTRIALEAVATSRFFKPVAAAPLLYEIESEGLNLGLALSLVSALESEQRNKRDPRDRLGIILEPIGALDEAAKVVFLAVQIACLQADSTLGVKAALIEHFVSLQNLSTDDFEAFGMLVKVAPDAFLLAAENVYCSKSHYANDDWLLFAMLKHRDDGAVWPSIEVATKRWLSLFSLAPERFMFKRAGRDTPEAVAEEQEKRIAALAKAKSELTEREQQFVASSLIETESWNFDPLLKATFYLLAGRPLEEFAPYFVRWAFSDAYGPAIYAADKEFRQLVGFNRVDWTETKDALLVELERLPEDGTSNPGKWARVEILRAIGSLGESADAEKLADWLTRDRERFPGWHRHDNYCATDPCDPASAKPDNIDATAAMYRSIDPAKLANHMGRSEEDHVFDMARLGVARFKPEDALIAHRALADDVLSRTDLPRRQGGLALLEHASALTSAQASNFLAAGQASSASFDDSDQSKTDEWLTAQYSVRLGLAHLTPNEQLDAVAAVTGVILLDTLGAMQAADEASVQAALERVFQNGPANSQSAVLGAIQYTKPVLTSRAREIISHLIRSENSIVRGQALGIAATLADPQLLKQIADSDWSAASLDRSATFERWYGSSAVLEAAKASLLPPEDALERMHLDHYGFAAVELGAGAASAIAKRVEAALTLALGYSAPRGLPEMTTVSPSLADNSPPLVSLSDSPPKDQQARWDRIGETTAQFNERQNRAGQAFDVFVQNLTKANANLVLSDLTLNGMRALVAANPDAGRRWLVVVQGASDQQLMHLHHVGVQLALAMAGTDQDEAARLLDRLLKLDPTVRRVSGAAKLPTEALQLWRSANLAFVDALCRRRLVTRRTNAEIATEVNAALLAGRGDIVQRVVSRDVV